MKKKYTKRIDHCLCGAEIDLADIQPPDRSIVFESLQEAVEETLKTRGWIDDMCPACWREANESDWADHGNQLEKDMQD